MALDDARENATRVHNAGSRRCLYKLNTVGRCMIARQNTKPGTCTDNGQEQLNRLQLSS